MHSLIATSDAEGQESAGSRKPLYTLSADWITFLSFRVVKRDWAELYRDGPEPVVIWFTGTSTVYIRSTSSPSVHEYPNINFTLNLTREYLFSKS